MTDQSMTVKLSEIARLPWSRGVSLALVGVMAAIVSLSVTEAAWTPGRDAHVAALWLGALCGLALSLSRWRSRTAFAYNLALSLVTAFETLARVWPPLSTFSRPAADVVWGMHVRLLIGWDRVVGWLTSLRAGDPVQDTGLFIFLLALTAWNALAWLIWCLVRRQRALEGILPLGVLLALNAHLSAQPVASFGVFLTCGMLLVAITHFSLAHADWEQRGVDYPDGLWIEWGFSAAALTLAVGLAVWVAPYAATPKGWRAIADLFRGPVAETASQLFSGVNPPRSESPALFALTPDLSRIGAPIPQSADPVMWVRISDPAPPPPQAGIVNVTVPRHYWRNAVFAAYTGAGWEPAPETESVSIPAQTLGRYELRQDFEIVAAHGSALFAVNRPVSSSAETRLTLMSADDALLVGESSRYSVTSLATNLRATQLISAPLIYPEAVSREYLQLPENLPTRVRNLAERITADAATPYDKALRLQSYLRETYPYKLDTPSPPPGRDAVDYFLFEAPGGFCSYYASAMAVMLRAEGVPARVAAGYAMGDFDYDRGAYRVPASAAHAWVEVYFPDYGWVEFEPTAALSEIVYAGETRLSTESSPPEAGQQAGSSGRLALTGLVMIVALLVVAGVIGWWRGSCGLGQGAPRGQARALYRHVRQSLASLGLSAPLSATPDEFLAEQTPVLAKRPSLLTALSRATALYLRAVFSQHEVSSTEAEMARRGWRRARGEWLRALVAHRLSRIANRVSRIARRN